MNTTHNPESTHGLGSLRKLGTRAVLAGGLGLAVIGLGAGTANAKSPEISCPTGVVAGQPSTATVAGWPAGALLTVWKDQQTVSNQNVIAQVQVDDTLAAPTTKYWYIPVPALPAGHHSLIASENDPGPGFKILGADCQFDVT